MPPNPLQPIVEKATALIWPIVAMLLIATAVRIGVVIYMKQRRFRRKTIDLVSYLASAGTLFVGYLLWSNYAIQLAAHP